MSTLEEIMKWAAFSVQLLPLILQGIMMAEGAIGAGNGEAKKQMVLNILPPTSTQEPIVQDARRVASSLIDETVFALNKARKLPLQSAAGSIHP